MIGAEDSSLTATTTEVNWLPLIALIS